MELRQYWQIIWRRAWIPVVLVIAVAAISLLTAKPTAPTFTSSMRFVVGVEPERVPGQFNYDGYYAGISSEFVADDLSAIVSSQAFANDINRHLEAQGSAARIPPGAIGGVTFADKQHRILQLNMSWGNPDELAQIGQAAATAIQQDSEKYLTQLGAFGGLISVIDPPSPPAPVGASLTQKLDLPVRLILAFIAGVALTFLLHYLDPSIRNTAELESMGLAVVGQIPRHK